MNSDVLTAKSAKSYPSRFVKTLAAHTEIQHACNCSAVQYKPINSKEDTKNLELAMVKLRATIVSDGGLYLNGRNAHFCLSLSDNKDNLVQRELIPIEDLLKFLHRFVAEVLGPLGIELCDGHPRIELHITKSKDGGWLPGVLLTTRNSEFLTRLHHEYYPDGSKIIPESFVLTGVFLAWFFMFDGISMWNGTGGPGVYVRLCTHGFDLRSVELFEEQLHKIGINTGRTYVSVEKGAGIMITILAGSTDHFMKIIDPYVITPYRYKIKYRGSCPPELATKYRKHHNKQQREVRKNLRAKLRLVSKEQHDITI